MKMAFLSHKLLLCSECVGKQRSREEALRGIEEEYPLCKQTFLSPFPGHASYWIAFGGDSQSYGLASQL